MIRRWLRVGIACLLLAAAWVVQGFDPVWTPIAVIILAGVYGTVRLGRS